MSDKPNETGSKFDCPLYIVGLNIDQRRAYFGVDSGRLEKVAPNTYLQTGLSPEDRRVVLTRNAARIAVNAFDNCILAGSSAYHRGVVEGHLMVAVPRSRAPVDVGGVFTVFFLKSHVDVGMNHEAEHVEIEDDFGPYTVKRMSDEMLILKNFRRLRERPATTYLNVTDLAEVVERSMRVVGGRDALMERLDALMEVHGMVRQRRTVLDFVASVASYTQMHRPLKSFKVFWHRTPVATLSNDGHIWSFDYEAGVAMQLSVSERRGKRSPPSFLGSLLPEVEREKVPTMDERLQEFRCGHRYMSNITVLPVETSNPKEIIVDVLDGEIKKFSTLYREFDGALDRNLLQTVDDDLLLSQLQSNPDSPRLSGVQIKLATHLNQRGLLSSAVNQSFTHMLKLPPGNPDYHSVCSLEWFSLTTAKLCGINVEEFAVVNLGEKRGPALLVERFDVRRDLNDKRMILTEDFWSVFGMRRNDQKFKGELTDVADILLKHSSNPAVDGRNLIAQSMFSWMTGNSDMHLKNLLLLKETSDTRGGFDSIRLSPAYDIVCSQAYKDDPETAAIALCGSWTHTLAGFRKLGKKFGVTHEEVDTIAEYLSTSIQMHAERIVQTLPRAIQAHDLSLLHIEKAMNVFQKRCTAMFKEVFDARKGVRSADKAARERSGSFSGAGINGDVKEHVEGARRRSWAPLVDAPRAEAPPADAHRPRP